MVAIKIKILPPQYYILFYKKYIEVIENYCLLLIFRNPYFAQDVNCALLNTQQIWYMSFQCISHAFYLMLVPS